MLPLVVVDFGTGDCRVVAVASVSPAVRMEPSRDFAQSTCVVWIDLLIGAPSLVVDVEPSLITR